MALSHWFLPHPETHKKAHLISWHGFVIYILIFILLQVGFSVISFAKPGVLGINAKIDTQELISLTNSQRVKAGLSPLSENPQLDTAASAKAANMFAENYWAHFAPSGKSPWDFIQGSGYKFKFAGENLAKNFYTSGEVVDAWMASPTHKENIVSPKYKEIGMAVVEGNLNGQKTTLVVQMFGNSDTITAVAQQESFRIVPSAIAASGEGLVMSIDPYRTYKFIGLGILGLIITLLMLDFVVLRTRGVYRPTSHHFAKISFLAAGAITLASMSPGSIL